MTTERIEINPAIMMGKPVIRGTRITVELILRKLAEGASEAELLQDYPHLTTEDIRASVAPLATSPMATTSWPASRSARRTGPAQLSSRFWSAPWDTCRAYGARGFIYHAPSAYALG